MIEFSQRDLLQKLWDELEAFGNSVTEGENLKKFQDYLGQLRQKVSSKDILEGTTIATLILALKELLLFVITIIGNFVQLVEKIVGVVIDYVGKVVSVSIYVPRLSEVYKHLTGESFSAIGLVSLIAAISATVFNDGKSPFPKVRTMKAVEDPALAFYRTTGALKIISCLIEAAGDFPKDPTEIETRPMLKKALYLVAMGVDVASVLLSFDFWNVPDQADPNSVSI